MAVMDAGKQRTMMRGYRVPEGQMQPSDAVILEALAASRIGMVNLEKVFAMCKIRPPAGPGGEECGLDGSSMDERLKDLLEYREHAENVVWHRRRDGELSTIRKTVFPNPTQMSIHCGWDLESGRCTKLQYIRSVMIALQIFRR